MPLFNASVISTQNLSGGCWIEIDDSSNYVVNDQPVTHALSRFDTFFKVKITKPDSAQYVYSAQTGGDALVPAPADSIFSAIYNLQPLDINGTYTIEIVAVPTFTDGDTYSNVDSDVVFHNGDLWAANTAASTNIPVVSDPHWDLIDEPTLEAQYPKYFGTSSTIISCLSPVNFSANIEDIAGENTIEVLPGCLGLSVTDTSNYNSNNNNGHAFVNFSDYIRISVTRPDNSSYILSSVIGTDVDESIAAPYFANGTYNFLFQEDIDQDGIYTVRMCVYPTWDVTVTYTSALLNVTYYEGVLYKALTASLAAQPDLSPLDWEVYEPTLDEEILTRYCMEHKVVVLCLDVNECNERLIHKAFCEINNDFCNDDMLCKNRDFLNATKLLMLKNAMVYSINRNAWNEVESQMNRIRTICNC